jgi:hypothetical protein
VKSASIGNHFQQFTMQAMLEKFCSALLERLCSALLFFSLGIFIGRSYDEDKAMIIAYWSVGALLIGTIILSVMDVRQWRREIADSKSKTLSETKSTH